MCQTAAVNTDSSMLHTVAACLLGCQVFRLPSHHQTCTVWTVIMQPALSTKSAANTAWKSVLWAAEPKGWLASGAVTIDPSLLRTGMKEEHSC